VERGQLAGGLRALRLGRQVTSEATDTSSFPWARIAWAFLAVLALNSLRLDWDLVGRTGSIDFRNRITGVRLLVAGEDPYHYKWLPGAPAAWCDVYANRALPVTKTTVPPAMLLVGGPLAVFPYPVAQRLWLLLEWALLGGIWWIWFSQSSTSLRTRLGWTALLVAFTYTLAWRHHIDRGQAYIPLAFLFSLWMTRSLRTPTSGASALFTGAIAGLLIALRPPLLLLIAPFLWLRRPDQRKGALIALAAAILLPWLLNGGSWGNYAKAMGEWSHLYRHNENPAPGPLAYPAVIEGLKLEQLSRYGIPQYADSSIIRLLRACGIAPVPASIPLAALLLLLAGWTWANRDAGDGLLLSGLASWSFLADFFLPAYRNPYNDVMILITVGCLVCQTRPQWFQPPLIFALCALPLGWILVSTHPDSVWWIHLPTFAWLSVALLALRPSVPGSASR
jgi:hypothetical protein